MRFIFKTSYDQDIRLVKHGGQVFWYGLLGLALAAAPLLPEYYLSQLTFVCIYALVGVGLMLLTGYTGQISLGHAAFLAVGAYTEAVLQAKGVPFGVSLVAAAALAGLAGIVIGLPALRLTGIYLAIATIAFGFIVQEVLDALGVGHARQFAVLPSSASRLADSRSTRNGRSTTWRWACWSWSWWES